MAIITRKYALELLNSHTNKITANKELIDNIKNQSPPNIQYSSIKHRLYHIGMNLKSIPVCANKTCDNNVKWDTKNQRYNNTCGYQCSNILTSKNPNIIQKRKKTNQQKYGGNAPACNPTIVKKMQHTSIKKYGDDYKTVINQLSQKAVYEKYGENNISRHHIPDESKELLNDKDYLYNEHIRKKQPLQVIASNLGVTDTTINRYMHNHGIEIKRFYKSAGESEIQTFLDSLGVEYITNSRKVIPPHEIDIYIPSAKIAIEYNGVYWHSEQNGKSKQFHLIKTNLCEKENIRLIHIFEDEWRDMKQQCKDTIAHLLGKSKKGTYARNTTIKEISWKIAKEFLNEYHLLNAGTPGNYRIGAFDKDSNLIGVMVFGIPNNEHADNTAIELKRFVTNKRNNPGLGSKMFKHAIRDKGYTEVIAFVDRRWFTGLVKQFIGFEKDSITPPALWWTDGKHRYHRRFITKQQLIKQNFDSTKSKKQILNENGYYRIWDCGKIKLKWKSQ